MGRNSKDIALKDITYGVIGSVTDLIIWSVALVGASFGKTGTRGIYQSFREADEILEKVNHRTLAATWHQLTKKKLLTYEKRRNLFSPKITKFGLKRLKEVIPQYYQERLWDGYIYLITYDIPQTANTRRDIFRVFLKQINCKMLQESTWLTPYNPRELIHDFVRVKNIPGTVIVSNVGKDGGIGETTVNDLLVKLYMLEKLNDRYDRFLKNAKKKHVLIPYLLFEYLSILKDDPQLPFVLLPPNWLGDKAHKIYEILKKQYILSVSQPRGK